MADERRFKASIYVEIFVPITPDLEVDRQRARDIVRDYQEKIPNSYIGGVAHLRSDDPLNPLDKII